MKKGNGHALVPESADRARARELRVVGALCSELSIPAQVADEAALIYEKGLECGLGRGRQLARISASSLYAACREREVPATLDEVAAASGVGRKELASSYRRLVNELNLRIPVADPAEYVAMVASKTNMCPEVQTRALGILSRAEKTGIAAGKYPKALAAAALYMAAALEGERLTQKCAAEAAGVREITLRKENHRLRAVL